MIREIVTIDEELCDGCGLCVPSCQEGAIRIINGKARLVSDRLCDGLGACLGHCPKGAIRIERREAEEFDEQAVQRHLAGVSQPLVTGGCPSSAGGNHHPGGGCPGSRFAQFVARGSDPNNASVVAPGRTSPAVSELGHWPVQLHLMPPNAPVLRGARLLVAADCVPVAYGGFHSELLRGRVVVIACPKLDDTTGYVEKLAAMIAGNDLTELTVARMEVPCCGGLVQMVHLARQRAGVQLDVNEIVISTRGDVLST